MITEYIRYRIPDGRQAEFEAAYGRASAPLAASPHCRDFELTRCQEEPDRYILRIRWDSLEGHLQGFRQSEEFRGFLAQIREFVAQVEEMAHYQMTGVAGEGRAGPPSLYEWAGGYDAFERLFERFYDKVLADDLLGPLFEGMEPDHPRRVAVWLSEAFGGPTDYTAHHGGYENMLAHHVGRSITEAQRRRWVNLILDAADEVDLPRDPEFRAAFIGYIEWGTRLASENSQPGAAPVPHAPVPRWGWGITPPWQR